MFDIHQRILPKMADPFQNTLGGHQINGGVVEMRLFLDVLRLRNGNGNLNKPPYQGLDISMGEQTSQSLERYIAAFFQLEQPTTTQSDPLPRQKIAAPILMSQITPSRKAHFLCGTNYPTNSATAGRI
jgi:hypothetical protein